MEREEILALVVCLLSQDAEESKVEQRVSLVSPGLLPLTQTLSTPLFCVNMPNGVVDCAHPSTGFEVVDGLVDGGLVVADDTDGMQGGEVAEIPLPVLVLELVDQKAQELTLAQ